MTGFHDLRELDNEMLVARGVAEPKREPLSDEQADKLIIKVFGPNADLEWHTELVRATERAHGIGGSDAE